MTCPSDARTSEPRMVVSNDGQFVAARHVTDNLWRWSWLAGSAVAAIRIDGTRGYSTSAGAFTGARAATRKLVAFCRSAR